MAAYKTIVLELLKANPTLHKELCLSRKMPETLDRLAEELRDDHQLLKEQFQVTMPWASQIQISQDALEMAVQDLRSALAPTDTDHDETATTHSPLA